MRVSIVLVVLLSTMLVTHTEAGWLKKLASGVKTAVTKVASFVKNSPLRLLGKRSVDRAHPYPREDRMGRPAEEGVRQTEQIMEELELACPTFGINPDRGLNKEVLDDAFEESDDNGDGELDEKELYFLESTVEVYEQCVVMLAAKKK